jgi:hypothetical protein
MAMQGKKKMLQISNAGGDSNVVVVVAVVVLPGEYAYVCSKTGFEEEEYR